MQLRSGPVSSQGGNNMRSLIPFIWLILALYGAYVYGTTKVPQHRLEGTQWCFFSEYSSLKAYGSTVGVPHALVDVQRDKVKVYAKCQ